MSTQRGEREQSFDLAVVIGAPRSGTSWLQQLLASHPRIASPPETHLFHRYLGPTMDTWRHFTRLMEANAREFDASGSMPDRLIGLQTILSTDDFVEWCRDIVDRVGQRAIEQKRTATMLLEKTPSNTRRIDDIDLLRPDARFIHVLRDGRDVAASLMSISRSWGARWAPDDPIAAGHLWADHVSSARRAARFGPRYLEVRYERLRQDTVGEVLRVFDFLGLSCDPADAVDLVRAPHRELVAGDATVLFDEMPPEPPDFRSVSGRRLSRLSLARFEAAAAETLTDCGYELRSSAVSRAVAASTPARALLSLSRRAGRRQIP